MATTPSSPGKAPRAGTPQRTPLGQPPTQRLAGAYNDRPLTVGKTCPVSAASTAPPQKQVSADGRPRSPNSPEAGRWLGQVRSWSEWLHGSWGEGDRRLARCSGRSPSRTSFRGE